jgi:hypothetical protein
MGEPNEDVKLVETTRGATVPSDTMDYKLLLDTLSKRILGGCPAGEVEEILLRKEAWQSLEPADALRWSALAQAVGRVDLSLEVLEWITQRHPSLESAWSERLELLWLVGAAGDLVRARRQAIEALGEARVRRLFGGDMALSGSAAGRGAMTGICSSGTVAKETLAESALRCGQTRQDGGEQQPRTREGVPTGGLSSDPWSDDEVVDLGGPFVQMHREDAAVKLYMEIFRGRPDVFARQWYDEETDTQGYVPVRRPMLASDVQDHLRGNRTYGIYLLDQDSRAWVGVIDVDLVPSLRGRKLTRDEYDRRTREETYLVERLSELSSEEGLPCVAEFTGGKGYHFWYPFEEPVSAASVRAALRAVVAKIEGDLSCFQLEVFPKQDTLSGKSLGNLVKLPLGVHRATGKPSFFLLTPDRSVESQLAFLEKVKRIPAARIEDLAAAHERAKVVVHPRHEAWAREFPELAVLEQKCTIIAQILTACRSSRSLSVREEKVLLCTIGHLPQARRLLHHVFEQLPEYNRPLLDYKIARIRGTPLGCKRIHTLLGDTEPTMPCRFETQDTGYWTPLLHLEGGEEYCRVPKSERVENLEDALEMLDVSIRQVRRFLNAQRT